MKSIFLALPCFIVVTVTAQSRHGQPSLGHRSAKIITIGTLRFKDLNRNGRLDAYEDWRLGSDARAHDLLSKMTLEDKAAFMLISTTRMKNDQSLGGAQPSGEPVTSDFNEEDLVQGTNMFTRKPLPVPIVSAAGTTKAVTQYHLRHFILRANAPSRTTAEWSNKLQALCEGDGFGIPAIVASNPRNHITKDASAGLSVGATVFSTWPGELGMSAMRDLKLVRTFADIARQEWRAVGLRKGYMYMADLSTEPRWQRIEGTFGENAEWTAKMITEIVLGFQGDHLSGSSVALTTKHFPGGGSGVGGQDPHFDWGKYEHFPGHMLSNNLIPFKAAIRAGTSAIMPYYSIPLDTKYAQVAYAYNKAVITGLLRDSLGFKGIINSDTGPIEMMPWGVEALSITERYQKALDAGVNLFSGTADPTQLLETIRSGKVDMKLIDRSVYLLLLEEFNMGLFEDPYVDEDRAAQIVGNEQFRSKADLAMRKSIVLLRNPSRALPLKAGTRVYFESWYQRRGAQPWTVYNGKNRNGLVFVQTPEEADVTLLWVTPGAKSLFESNGSPIYLSLSKNGVDIAHVAELASKKPTILVVNYSNPWIIDEVYNEKTRGNFPGVLATFGTTPDALIDVVSGKFNPSGRMPFTTPVSEAVVATQKSDVPGYLKGKEYALFKWDEGMRYEK